ASTLKAIRKKRRKFMPPALPMIYCPNLKCRTLNNEGERICQQCGTSLPQRYLWVVGADPETYPVGSSLLDRYWFRGPQVVIDTQPGIPLVSGFDIADAVLPYLKLFPLRLHIPQVYSLVSLGPSAGGHSLLLLEGVPLTPDDFVEAGPGVATVAVAESLTAVWSQTHPLRQMHWLWQMAQLWTPLQREAVSLSLVEPQLIRVEGPLVRLRELKFDPTQNLTLSTLGEFWTEWLLPHTEKWHSAFAGLCDRLIQGQIQSADLLIEQLESLLAQVKTAYQVQIGLATRTDAGPAREHNEDACYPPTGTVVQNADQGLAIVCDGVGGHAGGEVASSIAIAALTEHLQPLPLGQLTPKNVMDELHLSVGLANDLITRQNDQEKRQDRDRMGTTVVMALAHHHDFYITNLGDSRAYLITAEGCYQVTTDDDIATREVRLGYLPYREAIRQPGGGSLIQALGMVPSSMLRSDVQRFIIDSDCLILLCSDGLSDFERVESLWRDELLPLLSGQIDLAESTKRLVTLANRLNGHDNVTVSLIHCRVKTADLDRQGGSPIRDLEPITPSPLSSHTSPQGHRSIREPRRWPQFLGLALLALLGGGAAIGLWQWQNQSSVPPPEVASPPPVSPTIVPSLEAGTYWKVAVAEPSFPASGASPPTIDLSLRSITATTAQPLGPLLEGTVFKVIDKFQKKDDQSYWLKVQVCGFLSPTHNSPLKPGIIGYIQTTSVLLASVESAKREADTLTPNRCVVAEAPASP
ncbi:MAG: protein phosphatase 2C domain-containing protein, partial [Thermosynechococcaceae cyanobacterium]